MKFIKNNQNYKQKITVITSFFVEFISISISSLAFWFIPQSIEYNFTILFNLQSLEWYWILVINMNIISTIAFWILYIFEIKREFWLINTFDYSKKYDSLHLSKYKKDYPDIFLNLENYNWNYYMVYYINKIFLISNILFSSVIIIYVNKENYKTITCLFTNFWICYSKISKGLDIAKDSIQYNIGYAYYNTQNLSFNRIDPQIKKHFSTSNLPSMNNSRINSRRPSVQSTSDSLNNSQNNIKFLFDSSNNPTIFIENIT
jgi:hypothetical protein